MHKSEDNIEAFDITTISEKKSSTMFSIEITNFQRFSITERQTNWLFVPIRPFESVYIKCLQLCIAFMFMFIILGSEERNKL